MLWLIVAALVVVCRRRCIVQLLVNLREHVRNALPGSYFLVPLLFCISAITFLPFGLDANDVLQSSEKVHKMSSMFCLLSWFVFDHASHFLEVFTGVFLCLSVVVGR